MLLYQLYAINYFKFTSTFTLDSSLTELIIIKLTVLEQHKHE